MDGGYYESILPGMEVVYAVSMVDVAAYDPVTDAWHDVSANPGDQDALGAGIGPDGRIYLKSFWDTRVTAWDGESGRWLSVQPPPYVDDSWRPLFLTGPDGQLWALDDGGSFVFTPAG